MVIIARLIGLVLALLLSWSVSAIGAERDISRVACKKVHGKCVTKKITSKKAVRKKLWVNRLGSGPLDGNILERRRKIAYENKIAYKQKLPRFGALEDIRDAHGSMVRVTSDTPSFYVDDHVHKDRRYLQSWSKEYLEILARDFMKEVGGTQAYPKLKVTSLVRDLGYQKRLRSAAQCQNPESCSTHLTGAAFDISFKGMSQAQKSWMYRRLTLDRELGIVNAIHEPWSGCFHVFVIRSDEGATPTVIP